MPNPELCSVGIFLLFMLLKQIVPPLKTLTVAAHALAMGDTEIEIDVHQKDELGTLAVAFQEIADEIKLQAQMAIEVSRGNFTIVAPIRSEKDIMNNAINELIAGNRRMIEELRFSAQTVG